MGTRSVTIIKDEQGQTVAVMYRQFDGYLSGHGAELKALLAGHEVVNGYGIQDPETTHNGAGCLAASVVCHFKGQELHRLGGIYLAPAGTGWEEQEYVYELTVVAGEAIRVRVSNWGELVYEGVLEEMPTEDPE